MTEDTKHIVKKIQLPYNATKAAVKPLSDGSVKIEIHSQREMTDEELTQMMSIRGTTGWVLFAPQQMKDEDVADLGEIEAEFPGQKSTSQRLRNTLYRVWETTDQKTDFEVWRVAKMEHVIQQLKDKYLAEREV